MGLDGTELVRNRLIMAVNAALLSFQEKPAQSIIGISEQSSLTQGSTRRSEALIVIAPAQSEFTPRRRRDDCASIDLEPTHGGPQ